MDATRKPVGNWDQSDISYLVSNSVPEGSRIEYKSTLPDSSDSSKKEFLADISSLANSTGGVILYGIDEERDEKGLSTGVPSGVVGLGDLNDDSEIARLQEIINTGLQPRLTGIEMQRITVDNAKVIAIGVPRSLSAPHGVWFKNSGKFFLRTNNTKTQMDVHMLRHAFLQHDAWERQANERRSARYISLKTADPLVSPIRQPWLALHVFPLGFREQMIDIREAADVLKRIAWDNYDSWDDLTYNVDGIFFRKGRTSLRAYIQLFRDGAAEFFAVLSTTPGNAEGTEVPTIYGVHIEENVSRFLQGYCELSTQLGVSAPIVVFVSAAGVGGHYLLRNPSIIRQLSSNYRTFDRDEVLLPGVVFESLEIEGSSAKTQMFDIFWQAAGWDQSPIQHPL